MSFPQGWELVLIVLVIVLLFGARKLPDAARGIGRSLRIFKAEVGTKDEDDTDKVAAPGSTTSTVVPPAITSTPTAVVAPPVVDPVVTPVEQPVMTPVAEPKPVDR